MLGEIEISSPQPFDPGQAVSKQVWGQRNKFFLTNTFGNIKETFKLTRKITIREAQGGL